MSAEDSLYDIADANDKECQRLETRVAELEKLLRVANKAHVDEMERADKAEARIAELEEKKAQCKKALSAQLRINSAASTRRREEIVSRLEHLGVLPTDPDYARLPVEQLVCHVVGELMGERDETREVIREAHRKALHWPEWRHWWESRCPWLTEGGA